MAKNSFPTIKTGTSLLTKAIGFLTVIAVLTLVIKHPTESANWLSQAGHFIGAVIDGIASFLQHALE